MTIYQIHPVFVFAAAIVLGGSTVVASGCDTTTEAAAAIALPPAEEEELGEKVDKELREDPEIQMYEGEKVNEYIRKLGNRAAEVAADDTADAIEYEFQVIDEPDQVNAFAGPGGQIYFYTGLITTAESEAEVMAVMSHEVAHVSQRHVAKNLTRDFAIQKLAEAALGNDPGVVGEIATALVGAGTQLQFTRKMEKEADEVGFEYQVDAGYHPKGFVSFFEKIKEQQGVQPPVWLSSHPLPQDRIDAAKERIGDRSFDDAIVGEESHREIVEAIEANSGGDDSMGDSESDAGSTADAGQ